jgi:hypothetical protein
LSLEPVPPCLQWVMPFLKETAQPPLLSPQSASTLDGLGDGPDTLLCAVLAAPRALAQELQDLPLLPPRLRLHSLACQLVLQHCRKLAVTLVVVDIPLVAARLPG